MKKFNYRVTVNINGSVLSLGFRGRVPEEMEGKSFRLQAIFSQRMTQRRFPMNVIVEEGEEGWEIRGDADVELPYVFYAPPKYQVNITFALWCGMQEMILDDQPFPVEKDLFSRTISGAGKRNLPLFALCTLAVPFITLKYYLSEDHNVNKALRKANAVVHDLTGYSYSSRQKNTDYFASMYNRYVARNKEVQDILFLSERLPEEDGNLRIIEREFQKEQIYPITEFINTKRIDQLSKSEIRECAVKAARAKVIILEDFYPQLHAVRIRPETKVVQLWHACGAFKTFGLSRIGKPGGAPQSSMNHRNYDLVP
ncbi:MAG: CDP-glycerol glycerophosphotransferase family protein, partial [Lachnospiraceae bacterium]|nr:CDP-glycerol glycerophosphotransferase family protein [Lachnospiraceae bacterium]